MESARGGTEILHDALRLRLPRVLQKSVYLILSACTDEDYGFLQTKDRPVIFWAHQSYDQPSVQNLKDSRVRDYIDTFVFISEWQRDRYLQYLHVSPDRSVVIRNAIEPIAHHQKPGGKIQLVYTSTPFRGLDVLLDAFGHLKRDDVELHIYSGMQLYGRSHEDVQFAALYERARILPNAHYHGVVGNDEIRNALMSAHIFAYPSTWEETSCLAAIEALSAGCAVVLPRLGALPETAGVYGYLYEYVEDKAVHAQRFAQELNTVIDAYWSGAFQQRLAQQVSHYKHAYSWDGRMDEWISLYTRLARQSDPAKVSSGARNVFTIRI